MIGLIILPGCFPKPGRATGSIRSASAFSVSGAAYPRPKPSKRVATETFMLQLFQETTVRGW